MPRYLARLPYGAKTEPVEQFAFEEETDSANHNNYVWSNAAYAMGVNVAKAFKLYGWCARIRGPESGGMVEGLPCHTFPTDDGGVDMKCPTEIAITDRRESELAKNGFIPLSHWKNTDYAVFMGAQSLQKPAEYDDPDATANANISARLPYLFAVSPFRALPQNDGARQDRLVQGTRRVGAMAQQLDFTIYRRFDGQRGKSRRSGPSRRRRSRCRKSRAIRATTPRSSGCVPTITGRPDCLLASRLQAAFRQGSLTPFSSAWQPGVAPTGWQANPKTWCAIN